MRTGARRRGAYILRTPVAALIPPFTRARIVNPRFSSRSRGTAARECMSTATRLYVHVASMCVQCRAGSPAMQARPTSLRQQLLHAWRAARLGRQSTRFSNTGYCAHAPRLPPPDAITIMPTLRAMLLDLRYACMLGRPCADAPVQWSVCCARVLGALQMRRRMQLVVSPTRARRAARYTVAGH